MVYVFLADGFEEIEAVTPIDILRRCGVNVSTISVSGKKTVTGAHGLELAADTVINEVDYEKADMLVLPGGSLGVENLGKCDALISMLKRADEDKRVIAAICAAPTLLGKLGLLKEKRATCYPSLLDELNAGECVREAVVEDGNVITSMGAGTSAAFGFTLAERLGCEEQAQKLFRSMCYKI